MKLKGAVACVVTAPFSYTAGYGVLDFNEWGRKSLIDRHSLSESVCATIPIRRAEQSRSD